MDIMNTIFYGIIAMLVVVLIAVVFLYFKKWKKEKDTEGGKKNAAIEKAEVKDKAEEQAKKHQNKSEEDNAPAKQPEREKASADDADTAMQNIMKEAGKSDINKPAEAEEDFNMIAELMKDMPAMPEPVKEESECLIPIQEEPEKAAAISEDPVCITPVQQESMQIEAPDETAQDPFGFLMEKAGIPEPSEEPEIINSVPDTERQEEDETESDVDKKGEDMNSQEKWEKIYSPGNLKPLSEYAADINTDFANYMEKLVKEAEIKDEMKSEKIKAGKEAGYICKKKVMPQPPYNDEMGSYEKAPETAHSGLGKITKEDVLSGKAIERAKDRLSEIEQDTLTSFEEAVKAQNKGSTDIISELLEEREKRHEPVTAPAVSQPEKVIPEATPDAEQSLKELMMNSIAEKSPREENEEIRYYDINGIMAEKSPVEAAGKKTPTEELAIPDEIIPDEIDLSDIIGVSGESHAEECAPPAEDITSPVEDFISEEKEETFDAMDAIFRKPPVNQGVNPFVVIPGTKKRSETDFPVKDTSNDSIPEHESFEEKPISSIDEKPEPIQGSEKTETPVVTDEDVLVMLLKEYAEKDPVKLAGIIETTVLK